MPYLNINDVIEPATETAELPQLARVLWLDATTDQIVLFNITETPKKPWVMRLSELTSLLDNGDIKTAAMVPSPFMLRVEEDLSEKEKAFRDKNWLRIQDLIETEIPGEIFQPGAMGRLIANQAQKCGIPKKAIYRLLYRYWMNGQVRNALLPNRFNSGGPGKPKQYRNGKKPGRRAHFQGVEVDTQSKILTEADKNCIRVGFSLFATGKVGTIADAYIKMLRRFYTSKTLPGGCVEPPLLPVNELPTARQFAYWGHKAYDDIAVLRGRSGERNWQKDHRPLAGTVRDGLRGPCHLFEIDATVADIYLVSRYNRDWVIGRPVVYVIIDTFSGMIAGVYVGLEGPSWNGARQALFNAFTPKRDFCADNGVEISADEWPCHHLPHEIFADRGEMLGQAAEGLASGLRINLGIAPPYRPDWKASFKVLNVTTQIHWIPGAVRKRNKERGDRDYRLDATLNLAEFTKIIVQGILHYNKHNRQPDRLSKEMIADQVEPTPVGIWNWALRNGRIDENVQADELIYLHLLPRDRGSIQKGGIKFKGMFYICDWAVEKNWFARARHRGVSSILCWYDPNSTEHIWIKNDQGDFLRCDLRKSESRYHGYRFDEVIDMLAIINEESPDSKYTKLVSKVSLDAQISGVVNAAKKDKSLTTDVSTKSEKLGNIRSNRANERLQERKESLPPDDLRIPAPPESDAITSVGVAENYAGSRGAEVIDLLSRLRPGAKK